MNVGSIADRTPNGQPSRPTHGHVTAWNCNNGPNRPLSPATESPIRPSALKAGDRRFIKVSQASYAREIVATLEEFVNRNGPVFPHDRIRVDTSDNFSTRRVKPFVSRMHHPGAGFFEKPNLGTTTLILLDQLGSVVRGIIVNDDDFVDIFTLSNERFDARFDVFRFIKSRNNHRQRRVRHFPTVSRISPQDIEQRAQGTNRKESGDFRHRSNQRPPVRATEYPPAQMR